jgi:inorganic triphosphatase YgiF
VHREIERKLDVPPKWHLPKLDGPDGVVGRVRRLPPLTLTATYYDTDDLRLARQKITLRRRTGGGDDGWHLKLPAGDEHTRDEVQLPLTTPGDPPRELVWLVIGCTRGAVLSPVAVLVNERHPFAVTDHQGASLAEITDDRVTVERDDRVSATFREVEVEAAPGRSAADLAVVVDGLVAAGAMPGTFASKAVRALGPDALLPPDVGAVPALTADSSAAEVLRAYLTTHVAALQENDLGARRHLDDAVHQMRVAVRRVRTTLKVFGPLFDEDWADHLRRELGGLGEVLGPVRDAEVVQAHLSRLLPGKNGEAARDLVRWAFHEQARPAEHDLQEVLHEPRYLALLDALVDAARAPRVSPAADGAAMAVLAPFVDEAWHAFALRAERLHRKGSDDPWHEARIRAKRVRYAAEAVAPVWGDDAIRFARRLAKITEVLGDHQDASIAADALAALAHGSERGRGVSAEAITALHRARRRAREQVGDARERFLDAWPDLAREAHRAWLHGHRTR